MGSVLGELFSWGGKDAGNHNLALFEEPSMPFFSSYLKAHTTPGPLERMQSENQKKKVGPFVFATRSYSIVHQQSGGVSVCFPIVSSSLL